MIKLQDYKTKIVGYGIDKEEAAAELMFNLIRNNITLSKEYMRRRNEIFAWLPLPNVLSIKGKTTIVYKDGTLQDTVTGEIIQVQPLPLSHYLYLYYLLGRYLSFEDFTITIAEEVNKFLNNISPDFGNIDDFPYLEINNDIPVTGIHQFDFPAFVGETEDGYSAAYDKTLVHVASIDGINSQCLVSYCLARVGVAYNMYNAYIVKAPKPNLLLS